MPPLKDKWIRRFVINETTRHKQGFTIYKVSSVIFLKSSPDTASRVSVWKRYNDFKKLHAALKTLHTTLQIKEPFPAFSKPKFFGRFEAEVIEQRRECAQKFLEFVARHTSLFTSDLFVRFFESSLVDDCQTDCSRSLGSDTSEDDKSTVLDNYEDSHKFAKPPIYHSTKGSQTIVANEDTINDNSGQKQQSLIPKGTTIETTVASNNATDFQPPSNNNNHNATSKDEEKVSEDLSWQRFLCVERLVEDGRSEASRQHRPSTALHDGSDVADADRDSSQYILIAAAHMSAGFRHEAIAEYEEAFMQYKLGIATLRQGVQKDGDLVRRATIIDKIVKYSERADRLYNRHLNCNISMISKPVSELRYYKVLRVMGSVMLVKDLRRETTKVIKTVEKPAGVQEDISKYILCGKVPYMVQLHACVQTETTVFLILQYASAGKMWDFLKKSYAVPSRKRSSRKKSCTRSASCEAIIHLNPEKRITTSREYLPTESPILHHSRKISPKNSRKPQKSSQNSENSSEDSLVKLEQEFGANSIYKKDLPTTQLLEKAQQLLKSVDATLKKSNSIASRMNDFGHFVGSTESSKNQRADDEKTEDICDFSEVSSSESSADLSSISDGTIDATSPLTVNQLPLRGLRETENKLDSLSSENVGRFFDKNERNDRLVHDEDSGIEMEQELWRVPDALLRTWTAQMLLALEALHQQNVIIADLRPDNILMMEDSQILLSYAVPKQRPELSKYQKPYTAPELCMYSAVLPATPAADVWSFGVLLYELFTGIPFQSRHPGPFHSHSIISIPNDLPEAAKSLLSKVLRFEPTERLTIPEIKQLPFFEKIDWLGLLNA